MKQLRILFSVLIVMGLALNLTAQEMPKVPIDPKVRYGKLENGLTYYIRHNEKPKDRAEFFIAQNVGAILEEDDQNGLAHFLEHMAFNGTTNFPDKLIIEYFESIGVKFGSNINAYTSLDETVYNLSDVPTIRQSVVDSALLVLHDWSGCISLLGEEIDAERGVILEEWRTGAGAERRMWKESNYLKYPGSQYAKRDVIGDTAVINNFDHETIRAFYRKWYRPDLQAILIVGDVDVDYVENKIKEMFADISAKENAGERPIYPIHDNVDPLISVVKDPEARVTRIELEYKHDVMPAEMKESVVGYMMDLVNDITYTIMGYRFDEITQKADAPFVLGMAYYGSLVKSKDAFQMIAIPKEGQETEGLRALMVEAEKLKRFGFTNAEVERAKTDILKSLETAYKERDNQENKRLVREYVRHYLDGENIPGPEWEYSTTQALMPQITAEMINQVVSQYITEENMIISFMAPDKPSVIIPSEETILELLADVKASDIEFVEEEEIQRDLITKEPKKGKIKSITYDKDFGTTTWLLKNGVTVIFKPTDFKSDEILMSAFSPGGISKVKKTEDLITANLATSIVGNNGVGNFSQIDLNKALTGKVASVSPSISNYEEGFRGQSSVEDFETMLQLVYLYFTSPRKDDDAYEALLNMFKTSLANSANDPRKTFQDSVSVMLSNRHPRTVVLNLEALDQLNQDKALKIFKDRFAIPGDFTFVFTGNVNTDSEEVQNAVLTYLGGLKSKRKKEKITDHKMYFPRGLVENHFSRSMQITKASNFILYSGHMSYNLDNVVTMTALGNVLSMRYLESIREKEGGSYGVGVRGSLNKEPINQAAILMQFDTDPDKQEHLMSIIHKEVDEIVENGPRADDLQKVKENMLKKISEDLKDNNWWSRIIKSYQTEGLNYVNDYQTAVESLSAEKLQTTLQKLVSQGNVLEVVMKPE